MEYIIKENAPKEISGYRNEYTQGWIEYYKNNSKKRPTDNKWTEDCIRLPLINVFKNNCGYCGRLIAIYEDKKPAGQVDHFWPKAKYPKRVYVWRNYIWSCKDCNGKKSELVGFLNPCNKTHMQFLDFDSGTGKYILKEKFRTEPHISSIFDQTAKKTLFNTNLISGQKRKIYDDIYNLLEDIIEYSKDENENIKQSEYFQKKFFISAKKLLEYFDPKNKNHHFTTRRILQILARKNKIRNKKSLFQLYLLAKKITKVNTN